MFKKHELFIAKKFFFAKKKEKFISINVIFSLIGITLGVATLIIVMSVFNGFRSELVKRILGINAHITIYSAEKRLSNHQEIIKQLKSLPNIVKVNPLIDAHAMVNKDNISAASLIKGIAYKDLLNKPLINNNIIAGDINNLQIKNNIVIGDRLARKLGVKIGDIVSLVAPQMRSTVMGMVPRIKDYKIGAIFSIGMHEYDSSVIFMPLSAAQLLFAYKNDISAIEVMTKNSENSYNTATNIFEHFVAQNIMLSVNDWQQLNSSFINALKVERNVMFLILSLIIIVAAFNIISSLIMLVNDKLKHIALLRTMGLSTGAVTRIFFINGALIGLIGTLIGSVLGTLFSYNIDNIKKSLESLTGATLFDPLIYFLTDLPAEINPLTILLVILISLLICFLAAIYPARKAAKLQPVEILRYE